jgi:hypothetical protein
MPSGAVCNKYLPVLFLQRRRSEDAYLFPSRSTINHRSEFQNIPFQVLIIRYLSVETSNTHVGAMQNIYTNAGTREAKPGRAEGGYIYHYCAKFV